MKPLPRLAGRSLIFLLLCSCAVGPDYKRPDVSELTPAEWHWKQAEPKADIPKGEWWKIFNDADLNKLENTAVANNQDLRAALARIDEARAEARTSRSKFFPELSLDPSVKRERTSGHLPSPIPIKVPSASLTTFSVPFDMSYEIDLWGRVRRSFEAAQAQARADVSDYENILLTLTADVAVDYFLVRSLDAEITTLQLNIDVLGESLRVMNERFLAGAIPEIDVAQAKTELASARADLADTIRQRTETINALALLCGRAASSFNVAAGTLPGAPPRVPAGLPAALLERRPDIARAEENLIASNARIGVARAAYFPALRLTGQAGFLSADADQLFSADSRIWSIGPGVSLPLFNAGRTGAEVAKAEAAHEEALAGYRQTVLNAFREVENSLAQVVLRNEQYGAQAEASASAVRARELADRRYEAGEVNYLELADAERNMLQQKRLLDRLQGQRFVAGVRLIKALGGGYRPEE